MVLNFAERFGRLSTGLKIFSIITLALLPLGLIALFASLAATRTADLERSADLRVALIESTRRLSAELASDVTAMRSAVDAISNGVAPDYVCTRLSAIFAAHANRVSQFAVFGPASAPLCATPGFMPPRPSTLSLDSRPNAAIKQNSLEINVPAALGGAVVMVSYPGSTLTSFAQPSILDTPFALSLSNERSTLPLRTVDTGLPLRSEIIAAPVGILGLTLTISAARVSLEPTEALLTFLPLLMWGSAALIGFFVVDRLLIRPLHALRLAVASHASGTVFNLPAVRTPAREIQELGHTFAQYLDEINQHESKLAMALADQTKATREVHHRVKNNLQVIASLISLHARGPHSPDAIAAYSNIQRRVDALSIVHRNHYAELDAGGIDMKALLSELATSLRAGAGAAAPAISISTPSLGVRQDSAVAIAFLLTELIELSMSIDPTFPIAIIIEPGENPDKARLTLTSSALKTTPAMVERLSGRYARVIEGLSRQLRSPLSHDGETGRFAIDFAIVARLENI